MNEITRRDFFAAAALQGLIANSYASDGQNRPLSTANKTEIAVMARDQADCLINALDSIE